MIKFENPNGYIEITNNYFEQLVGHAAQSCFGVTGMVNASPMQSLKSIIKSKTDGDNSNQGVTVKSINGALLLICIFRFHTALTSMRLPTVLPIRCGIRLNP